MFLWELILEIVKIIKYELKGVKQVQWQFIIYPITGSVIGYITNWVAIKMLFRPLTEKRIFGIRVPFTPGVIPGERDRIALSIGEAVSKYLLTEEQITRTLLERKTSSALRRFIRIKLHLLLRSESTLRNVIIEIVGGNDYFLKSITEELCVRTHSAILEESNQKAIIVYLQAFVEDFLNKEIGQTLTEEKAAEYALSISNTVKSFLSDQSIENNIKHYLEQKLINLFASEETLGSHLPANVIVEMEKQLSLQGPEIIKLLTGYLESPEIKLIIIQRVENYIESLNNGFLGLISGFIKKSSPMLAEKIYESINNFLLDENLQKELMRFLEEMLRSILNKKISEIAQKLHLDQESTRLEWVNLIYGQVLGDREIDRVINFCESYIKDHKNHTWNEMFGHNILKKEVINNSLANLVYNLINKPEFKLTVDTMVQAGVNNILDKKIYELTASIKNKDLFELAELLVANSQRLIPKYSPVILKTINIKSTIQRSVDGLDVSEIENVLLGITNKELTYITWFGALLGLIIGITTPLMELLTK